MTDAEIQQSLKNIDEDIARLAKLERKLTRQESRQKYVLPLKKYALERIKAARAKGDKHQETAHTIQYGILASYGHKHPFFLHIARVIVGSRSFY